MSFEPSREEAIAYLRDLENAGDPHPTLRVGHRDLCLAWPGENFVVWSHTRTLYQQHRRAPRSLPHVMKEALPGMYLNTAACGDSMRLMTEALLAAPVASDVPADNGAVDRTT